MRWYSASTTHVSNPLVTNTTAPAAITPMASVTSIEPDAVIGPATPKVRSTSPPAVTETMTWATLNNDFCHPRWSIRSTSRVQAPMATAATVGAPSRTIANAKAQLGVTSPPSPNRNQVRVSPSTNSTTNNPIGSHRARGSASVRSAARVIASSAPASPMTPMTYTSKALRRLVPVGACSATVALIAAGGVGGGAVVRLSTT